MFEQVHREGGTLVISAVVGTLSVLAQAVSPDSSLAERLGVAGLLVCGAALMLRYFMSVVERKDAQLERMASAHAEALTDHTRAMTEHLRRGYEVQEEMTEALHQLTTALKERRRGEPR